MKSPHVSLVDVEGGTLRYECIGEGPPLLVLPPLAGSIELYSKLVEAFATTMRVHLIEPRGSGASDAPAGLPSTRRLAGEVIEAMEALGLDSVHLFGISLGGMVAQWVAIDAPTRIRSLTLASTSHRGLDAAIALEVRDLAFARSMFLPTDEAVVDLVGEVLDGHLEGTELEEAERAALVHPPSKATLAWLAAAGAAHAVGEELSEITAPVLLLFGADDRIFGAEAQEQARDAFAGARCRVFPGIGHDLGLEIPGEVARAVRDWASACDAS